MCQTRLKGGPNWWVAAVLRGERSKAAVASTLLVRPEGHPQFRSAPAARQYSSSVGGHVQLINKHVRLSTEETSEETFGTLSSAAGRSHTED